MKHKTRILILQKCLGIALLVVSILFIISAAHGITMEEKDCTAMLVTIPLGLLLVLSRNIILDI